MLKLFTKFRAFKALPLLSRNHNVYLFGGDAGHGHSVEEHHDHHHEIDRESQKFRNEKSGTRSLSKVIIWTPTRPPDAFCV